MINRKMTLEARITRLEKLLSNRTRNEARMPKSIGDAMVNAIFKNDNAKAMQLLDAGADPNCKNKHGMSALCAAVNCHNLVLAKALLDAGADPNEIVTSIGVDWYGDGEDIEDQQSLLELAEWDTDSTDSELARDSRQMVALLKRYGAR